MSNLLVFQTHHACFGVGLRADEFRLHIGPFILRRLFQNAPAVLGDVIPDTETLGELEQSSPDRLDARAFFRGHSEEAIRNNSAGSERKLGAALRLRVGQIAPDFLERNWPKIVQFAELKSSRIFRVPLPVMLNVKPPNTLRP